jgi:hypothetical protein
VSSATASKILFFFCIDLLHGSTLVRNLGDPQPPLAARSRMRCFESDNMAGFHWVNIDPSRASRRSVRTMDPVSSLGSVGPQEDGRPPGRSSPPLGHDNPRARFDGGSMRRGCADSDVGCEGRKILRNTAVYGVVCTEYGIRSALCALLLQQRTYIGKDGGIG